MKNIGNARQLFREAHQIKKVSKNALKLEKFTKDKIMTILNSVRSNPAKYQRAIEKLEPFIGKKMAKYMVDQVLRMRRGQVGARMLGQTAKWGGLPLLVGGGTALGLRGMARD